MTGVLRVTPEKLISTAQQFSQSSSTVQSITSNMLETVTQLNSTWSGEAATAYYTKAKSLQESMNKMVRMIQEHSTDLQTMASNLQEGEKGALEVANQLKTDVIV